MPATNAGSLGIDISRIVPNPRQPRTTFNEEELQELAESIRQHGVIQPLLVTNADTPGDYILIAGERRLKASKIAGLEEVPVIVRDTTDQEMLELALIENVQRSDLSPLETAEAYTYLKDEFGLSHEKIAQRVGKSRAAVTNTIGLLDLSPAVRKALAESLISEGHARALKGLTSAQAQSAALQSVLERGLNVRQTEDLVRKLKGVKPSIKSHKQIPPELQEIETRLESALSTKVNLKHGQNGGTITIHYYSDEELNTLIQKLGG